MRRGPMRCLAAAMLFGASAPAASVLAGEMPAVLLAGLLYVGAGMAVTPAVIVAPPTRVAVRRDWRPAVTAAVVGGAVGPALLVAGLARTSAAGASIMLNLELPATVVLAATVFREHLGRRILAGAAVVTVAGVVLTWEPGAALDTGALLVAAACVAWGIDNGITARIDQLRPEHVVWLKGFAAGGTNVVLGLALATDLSSLHLVDVVAALAIGAAGYGASIVLWVKGARDLGAARGQVIFASAPFIGAVIAWTALGEAVTAPQLVAVALALIGVTISLDSAHEHEHHHAEVEHDHEHRHDDGHHDHDHDHAADDPDHADVGAAHAHTHPHTHRPTIHSHPHVPDLHHRHH